METLQENPVSKKKSNPSVWRSMSLFLVPLLLSNVLQSVGQLIGMVAVGRWLGVDALAAVSSFFPLFFLLISFTIGIGSGSSILIGQAYGAKNEERLKAVVGTTLTFTFLLGIVLAVIGSIFTLDILRLMGTPENVIDVSVRYARILFYAMPFMFLYFAYTTFLRGTGDSKTPFYTLIVSTVINIALLPIFILGMFGLPKLGIYGSAYATVISTIVTFIVLLVYLRKTKHPLQFDKTVRRYLKMDKELLALLLRLGIPSSINMILVSLSEIAVISFVNHYGSDATAAYGVVNQVASYVQMPAVSLGIAVSIFAAQSIGANEFDRLKQVIRVGIWLNYIIGGVLIVLIYLFAHQILALFLTEKDTLHIAHKLLMITLWSYLLFGNAQIISATMRASGTVLWPTLISIFAIWGIEVPVAFVLSHYTKLEILGVWVGYPAAFAVSLLLIYGYYQFIWKKKQITRLIQ
ncbi:MATE family efflux transporter [Bacillus mojavensis]|uniref:MATE family efflux transporter n=1 Tax=Bacillus mojavensis TaxID=72360 RepID=UPI002DBFD918|nr:MATE family efflux transporter [Bacillus mojavensis]MEC1625824.1 MATE family efflux transporter [Bacillus mojavensis]MEC1689820.1 MATE family efflux transporter [Bacillus mojavensis]